MVGFTPLSSSSKLGAKRNAKPDEKQLNWLASFLYFGVFYFFVVVRNLLKWLGSQLLKFDN
jgi:hypothetical protein